LGASRRQTLVTSSTGGANWNRPVDFMQMNASCFFFDPVAGRCNSEGPAGARNDLMAMPSVDIANGAPTGAGATNEIVDVWSDGPNWETGHWLTGRLGSTPQAELTVTNNNKTQRQRNRGMLAALVMS